MMLQSDGKISNDTTMYDQLAPQYRKYSECKIHYLNAIDNLVLKHIPVGAKSILDVGAGDGVRAVKIAKASNISKIVLAEPSPTMIALCQNQSVSDTWQVTAEELPQTNERFDVILCLWNVLGHIESNERRINALKNMAKLLSKDGKIYIDVNNRYNANSYGFIHTIRRFLYDSIFPSEKNGDVSFEWEVNGSKIPAMGHFFTPFEIANIIRQAGLKNVRRYIVDYETGLTKKHVFSGQLYYELSGVAES